MCGLAGFFRPSGIESDAVSDKWLQAMGAAIQHRGPDAQGTWCDEKIAMVHRRLSIIDLTEAANQPMLTDSGRYVIAFNGEIYNYLAIKKQLIEAGRVFHTESDTEVLLNLFEEKGFDCLQELNGMFAIAIWDRTKRQLFLARDRLGKKPLYYVQQDNNFAFASEIKALLELPFIKKTIRYDAVKDFFSYQYVPDPKTIFKGIYKLPPGYWLVTDGNSSKIEQYWNVSFSNITPQSEQSVQEELYNLIGDAVKVRMISDVPLGAFLSGGIDSSAVVGLMAGFSNDPVKTCAIGFDSKRFDEVQWASKVSKLFNTEHHEFTVKEDVASRLYEIASFFDEPFADPSFVPTYFVSQLARQKVTVALAGDGGDENFAGYEKYYLDQFENSFRSKVPSSIRRNVIPKLSSIVKDSHFSLIRRACSLMNALEKDPDEAYYLTNSFFRQRIWDDIVKGELKRETDGYDPAEVTREHYGAADTDDHLSKLLYTDIKTYLPGDILVKVDRMSMANSLETRAPLLDYRVVEYAATIPSRLKLKGKEKKYILKKTFSNLLPSDVLYRKKMGFSVPLAQWLRQEIFHYANSIFTSSESGIYEIFEFSKVSNMWDVHVNGDDYYTQELWAMLAFEMWWQKYMAK